MEELVERMFDTELGSIHVRLGGGGSPLLLWHSL